MKIMQPKKITISLILFLFFTCQQANAIPAFPGAEGFGANSIGGRGGTVIKVTNLNDSGAGSFRAAAEASGPRIIVFDVSGTILLNSTLLIDKPFITIAGQTSPGGIAVTGSTVRVNTHDVIIRHMRFRVGTSRILYSRDGNNNIIYYDVAQWAFPPEGPGGTCKGQPTTEALGYPCALGGGVDPETLDSFNLWGKNWGQNEAYNIIVDHCSISWGVDEPFSITGGVMSSTVQWCIVSEGLAKAGHPKGEHSKGLLVSGKYRYDNQVSLHHNYIAHNMDRNPQISSPDDSFQNITTVDVVNNVTYDWYKALSPFNEDIARTNWIQNYAKPGINSYSWSYEVTNYAKPWATSPRPLIYVNGNIGASRLTQDAPQWNVGWYYNHQLSSTDWQRNTPWPTSSIITTIMSEAVAKSILTGVGATAPVRDSVDTRVVNDFTAGTGTIINNVEYPNDYPTFSTPAPPQDTDQDGMPDTWENAEGLNVNLDDSMLDKDQDGYTNIEEYINYLSDSSYSVNSKNLPGMILPSIQTN